jgi:hypothetical protein
MRGDHLQAAVEYLELGMFADVTALYTLNWF